MDPKIMVIDDFEGAVRTRVSVVGKAPAVVQRAESDYHRAKAALVHSLATRNPQVMTLVREKQSPATEAEVNLYRGLLLGLATSVRSPEQKVMLREAANLLLRFYQSFTPEAPPTQ